MTEDLIGQLGYLGIVLLLVLGGLGLPVPEEAPIILAAILSKNGRMWWPAALGSCFVGVLVGDFVVYFLGFFYGEKVLGFRLTRKFLTRAREAQIKGYFQRHGIKIMILGRFVVGFRTAAYLTAGILRLPTLRLFLTDCCAASLSTLLVFGLGYAFAHQIEAGLREAQHWIAVIAAVLVAAWIVYQYVRARRRAGRAVGPPIPVADEVPLPPDDLHPASTSQAADLIAASPTGSTAAVQAEPARAVVVEADPVEPAPALDAPAPLGSPPAP